jgi:hypothetical protein
MKLQSSQFAEVFCPLRDFAKPYTQQDAADLAAIRAPMPPSASLIKRIKRHAEGVVHRDVLPPRPVRPDCELADMQRANYYKLIAELGGSRTIAPCAKGIERNRDAEAGLHFVPPVYNSDAVKSVVVDTPQQKLQKEGERLMRMHHTALSKAMYSQIVPHDFVASL